MKRLPFVLILVFLPWLSLQAQTEAPSVFIDTDPLGARIFLDGRLLAERTPTLLRGLKAGPHKLSVWHEGFAQKDESFEVAEGTVPTVELALAPTSAVLAFPANAEVTDAEGTHPTDGKQFRYPAGTYQVIDADSLKLVPVFPDEGLLTVAGWGLVLLSSAAVVATAADIYHVNTGWVDHPSELTAALWVSSLFELPWYGSLLGRKARFLRDAAPRVTALPERLNQAKNLFADGEAALQGGDLALAETQLARVVKEFPESQLVPGAWFRLARIHSVTGRRDLALGEYRLVAETFPQAAYYDRARKALADLYEAAGDPQKALDNLDRMVLVDGFFDPADIEVQKTRLEAAQQAPNAP